MYINPTLFGVNITGTKNRLRYMCSIFSLSSRIIDEDGTVLACQKRTGWWRLKFHIETPAGRYRFYKGFLNYYLEHESGVVFQTQGSIDFYDVNMRKVTELKLSRKFGKYWELDILTEEHKSALVLASVTMCKLNPAVY